MPVELFEMLKKDHEDFKRILGELAETTHRAEKTREDGLSKLKDELIPHMRAEEHAFYPVLKKHDETHELALEALEEHHAAEMVLNELSSLSFTAETWGAKIKVFQEMLEHHIEEEEGEVFDAAEETLDESQIDKIMQQVQAIKKESKTAVS